MYQVPNFQTYTREGGGGQNVPPHRTHTNTGGCGAQVIKICTDFDLLLTVHLSITSVINQLDAQNLAVQ